MQHLRRDWLTARLQLDLHERALISSKLRAEFVLADEEYREFLLSDAVEQREQDRPSLVAQILRDDSVKIRIERRIIFLDEPVLEPELVEAQFERRERRDEIFIIRDGETGEDIIEHRQIVDETKSQLMCRRVRTLRKIERAHIGEREERQIRRLAERRPIRRQVDRQ